MAENTDNKKAMCSVFLDLKKAFDTVNHNILLFKLESYGTRGLPHQLLKSYLSNRKHYTIINGDKSPLRVEFYKGPLLGPCCF